jgi:hypothetical protein
MLLTVSSTIAAVLMCASYMALFTHRPSDDHEAEGQRVSTGKRTMLSTSSYDSRIYTVFVILQPP